MAAPTLRRLVSSRVLPGRQFDLETLAHVHTTLVDERQRLRQDGAPADELERNRLAIVQCQWELSQALIERYLPPTAAPSAA
jgi:hypothetical protein